MGKWGKSRTLLLSKNGYSHSALTREYWETNKRLERELRGTEERLVDTAERLAKTWRELERAWEEKWSYLDNFMTN